MSERGQRPGGNGATELQVTERVAPRAKRESYPGIRVTWDKLRNWIIVLGAFGGSFGGAIVVVRAFDAKADGAAVRQLQHQHVRDIHRLELGLWEMRSDLRVIAPAEAKAKLDPLPPAPELQPFPGDVQ